MNKLFNDILNKFKGLIRAANRSNRHNKVILASIAPKNLNKTIAKYPNKCESIDKSTFEHQRAYESFIDRINKEYIQKFNCDHTRIHIPFHRSLRQHRRRQEVENFYYYKLSDGLHPNSDLKKKWKEFLNKAIVELNSSTEKIKIKVRAQRPTLSINKNTKFVIFCIN